ncbi:MAG: hypothetical protein LBC07_00240 [Elusimicrobiota bacterium]|nr:hypothetical protein [Elusimicrobiota bacterium]
MREFFFAKRAGKLQVSLLSPRWRDSTECCLSRGKVDFARGRKKFSHGAWLKNKK